MEGCRGSAACGVCSDVVNVASFGRSVPADLASAPSLAQIGFAGTGLRCAVAGGEASALGLPVAHFPMLVGVPEWCGGTAGRLVAHLVYVGRWSLGGVASNSPGGEVDGPGVWVSATIAAVCGGAFVGAALSFVAPY